MASEQKGSLVVVGTGIKVISQTTISARSYIENADIVFTATAGAVAVRWIESLNDNVVSLTSLYAEGKSRVKTYQQMMDLICNAVYEGKRVCAAFYGHPGVFVYPTHKVIKRLTEQGYQAVMEPGISAEDCIVADLGLDPGNTGCVALEATQFLFYQHQLDVSCMVILWQVGLSGDHMLNALPLEKINPALQVLTDALLAYYPPTHEVIIYEAATLAIMASKIERFPLSDLPNAKLSLMSTLVIPAFKPLEFDHQTLKLLGLSAEQVLAATKLS